MVADAERRKRLKRKLQATRERTERQLGVLRADTLEAFSWRRWLRRHPLLLTAGGAAVSALLLSRLRMRAREGGQGSHLARLLKSVLLRVVLRLGSELVAGRLRGLLAPGKRTPS